MKASAIKKSRVAAKKSTTNSNSPRAKKSAAKSVVIARKRLPPQSPLGANIGGFVKIPDDIMESEARW